MITVVELKCNASPLVDEQGNAVTEVGTITVADGKVTFAYLVGGEVPTPAYANIAVTSAMDLLGKDFSITFTGIQYSDSPTTPCTLVFVNGTTAYLLLVSNQMLLLCYLVDLTLVGLASWECDDIKQDFFVTAPRNITLSRTSKSWGLAIEGKTTNKTADSMEGVDLDSMEGGNLLLGIYSQTGGPDDLSIVLDNFKFEIGEATPPSPGSTSGAGGYADKRHFQRF